MDDAELPSESVGVAAATVTMSGAELVASPSKTAVNAWLPGASVLMSRLAV